MGRINIYFPDTLLAKLDELAKGSDMARSEYLQFLVKQDSPAPIHTSSQPIHTSDTPPEVEVPPVVRQAVKRTKEFIHPFKKLPTFCPKHGMARVGMIFNCGCSV